ncbi:hypothetical protein ARALYDRAFT_920516 [Arabidopsis lyrata subsp. lyrata]|uniref:Uncharacterized protein n=1 Tax=Arabidopsis lyrata subsp. lyrata TaxID=81972 RepID=D7MX91_ARALL|nr:hypothetical protein ARALYDRAFT_920516 [Arabidopsis lyrata subsp. lyrata]
MGNLVKAIDGFDGLAGGIAALAFVAMVVAVLPISSASVSMGDTGSLALGGALAVIAACLGMFFPLLISTGVARTERGNESEKEL